MEQVLSKDNLNAAYLQVVRNKGAAGVDGCYGFRPNRCAQQAAIKALEMMNDGHSWIVDIDLAIITRLELSPVTATNALL